MKKKQKNKKSQKIAFRFGAHPKMKPTLIFFFASIESV